MKPHSRFIIHEGINFFTIPAPIISSSSFLSFQKAVLSHGLDYSRAENPKNIIIITRETPSILQITVTTHESQVGQILVVAPNPKGTLELFIQEAEATIEAYKEVWEASNRQIVKADATIRQLCETTSPHAFQELWESRLGQSPKALSFFERPIRGGGLRFVLEPIQEDFPTQIEVKIESYLSDTKKIFIETNFNWPIPSAPNLPFSVRERLTTMNNYIENQVFNFLTGEINDN